MSEREGSLKSIFLALGANLAIFACKLVAALFTGSGSMLAESVHSLADSGNQGLLLLGMRQSRSPASAEYPLGRGRALYFWSFLVAVLLFSVGGMFSIYEGIHKLTHPEPLSMPWLALGVLAFSMVVEGISLRGCLQEVKRRRHGRSLWRWFRESRSSELLVIVGEDSAAVVGLGFAAVAVALTMVTGNRVFDAAGTLAIGALLMVVAVLVAIEIKALLIGQGVDPPVYQRMLAFYEQRPEIAQVYNLITLQMGTDVMVSVKARMADVDTPRALIEATNTCEKAFREAFPQVRWSFFEPDICD